MKEILPDLLDSASAILERKLSHSELDLIQKYLEILVEWNRVHRLVGSSDTRWLVDNIVLDSLLFLRVLPDHVARVLDVGSGAGVPGIPLKIVRPDMELVMVDARRKRTSFLSAAIRILGIRGATVLNARIEEIQTSEIGVFDAITARCTAEPSRLLGLAGRFLSRDGVAVVAGPPKAGISRGNQRWVRVRNPVTGLIRNFAILSPHLDSS